MAEHKEEWKSPGSPEYEAMMLVHHGIDALSTVVGDDPRILVGGFISFMAPGWAQMSDSAFEADICELTKGLRLSRAAIQSHRAVKS